MQCHFVMLVIPSCTPLLTVLSVEPRAGNRTQEELRSVGVGSGVGHGKDSRSSVLELEVLIRELVAIDGLSSRTIVVGEVTSLTHKVL